MADGIETNIRGLNEMMVNIEKSEVAVAAASKEVSIESAEQLLAALKQAAPVDDGTLQNELQVVETKDGKETRVEIRAGRAFHWWQVEFGNRFWSGKPFIRRTVDGYRKKHLKLVENSIGKAVKKSI